MEDIFSRSSLKTLASDTVKYKIFILSHDGRDEQSSEDLENCRIQCLALATSLTNDYIWNNEGFNLCLGEADGISCLFGETDFGDFIEDEWLIVWLLCQITKTYPDLACRVNDADGEFLLIEAADHLPKWLNIDTSKNRVFIYGGHLHIVSWPGNPGEIGKLPIGQPTLKSALFAIHNHPGLTQAHINITEAIQKRISGFPNKAFEYVQRVNVFLPEVIIGILDRDPNLISAAVRVFYYRDPIDLRACRVFKRFLPETRIWSQIPMNRCSYAQLMQQIFMADKRSGYTVDKTAGANFKGIDLGSKIAHGFEILCANCKQNQTQNGKQVFDEIAFEKYVAALENRDYFHGEIQGSKRHKELMANARAYFSKCSNESANNDNNISKAVGKRILNAKLQILSENPDLERLCITKSRLELSEEDGDAWMYLNDEKMDSMLSEMQKGFQRLSKKNLDSKNSEEMELGDLGEKMQTFVENISGHEGVECPDFGESVNFDPSGFEAALQKLSKIKNTGKDYEYTSSDDFLSSDEDSDSDPEQDSQEDSGILDVMQQMDEELASTNIGKSFVKEEMEESLENKDVFEPVDIDLNLVQNFLKSCESETDMSGAATTLLQSIGLNPQNM